jgi:hypothetical protein
MERAGHFAALQVRFDTGDRAIRCVQRETQRHFHLVETGIRWLFWINTKEGVGAAQQMLKDWAYCSRLSRQICDKLQESRGE